MIWFLLLGMPVILGFLAIRFGLLPPLNSTLLIRVRDGTLQLKRGRMRPEAREQTDELLRSVGVSTGFIALTPGNRVFFSWGIPSTIRQRLRNVILNQWA